jgi:hypothetical protein
VKWAKVNGQQLNISQLVLEGESAGGGNLCVALDAFLGLHMA